jgi:hypothetical protein
MSLFDPHGDPFGDNQRKKGEPEQQLNLLLYQELIMDNDNTNLGKLRKKYNKKRFNPGVKGPMFISIRPPSPKTEKNP